MERNEKLGGIVALAAGLMGIVGHFVIFLNWYFRGMAAESAEPGCEILATDARRAFPCWDEPDFKAVFATTLVIDPGLTAVSNTSVVSESVEAGKKVLRFADSMKMSTYLVAFIVGQLVATEPRFVGKTPIRLWTVPGKQPLTPFGRDIAEASLAFFEDYYGIPYPGDKLDLLAIPDFASGAMENLGAITFRETALLVDQRTGTHGELERVADVVAHENAHMWFGDLVTMSWWNGLWLNEAFAEWISYRVISEISPEYRLWDDFQASKSYALTVDALESTHPNDQAVIVSKVFEGSPIAVASGIGLLEDRENGIVIEGPSHHLKFLYPFLLKLRNHSIDSNEFGIWVGVTWAKTKKWLNLFYLFGNSLRDRMELLEHKFRRDIAFSLRPHAFRKSQNDCESGYQD